MRPFVAIMSTMRTGSTLLQEMLTSLPQSFIFHEPSWHRGMFQGQALAHAQLSPYGIDIDGMVSSGRLDLGAITSKIEQIGVKEIRLEWWNRYASLSDDPRFILTVRDPRDVYISCHNLQQRSNNCGPRVRPMTPQSLFAELGPEYQRQLEITNSRHKWRVWKYEDICGNPGKAFSEIAAFVKSPLKEMGRVGAFHSQIERGKYEVARHGSEITGKSVSRWSECRDAKLRDDAEAFFDKVSGVWNKLVQKVGV